MKSELVESQIDVASKPNDSASHSLLAEANSFQQTYRAQQSNAAADAHLPNLSFFDSEKLDSKTSTNADQSDVVLAASLTFTHNGQPVVISNGGYPIVVPRK
jgi:hypothetical protein